MPDGLNEGTQLVAPLPGVIVMCEKNIGEQVQKGDVVLILEAMKMEILITATDPRQGCRDPVQCGRKGGERRGACPDRRERICGNLRTGQAEIPNGSCRLQDEEPEL